MKKIIVGLTLVVVVSLSMSIAYGELVTLVATSQNPTNSLVLLAGEDAQFVAKFQFYSQDKVTVETPRATFDFVGDPSQVKIGGPATITIKLLSSGPAMVTFQKTSSANANTVNVIPKGQGAIVQLQTTDDLVSGQWMTLFSQAYTNSTPTNKFFKFTLSALN